MAFQEYAHDFGVVTASTVAAFTLPAGYAPSTFRGNASVGSKAIIKYAIVRNASGGSVVVAGGFGPSTVGIGERKRIEFPSGTRFFTIFPSATTSAGQLTADVGVDGVTL